MTKHTQNAIEAIFETAPVGCTIRDAERIYLAALPHIRKEFASMVHGRMGFAPVSQYQEGLMDGLNQALRTIGGQSDE